MTVEAVRRDVERWFLRRGLPHFTEGYSASRDVLTRAVPLFALIFLVEVANAPKADFALWQDVVAVAMGLALLVGAWALLNRARHRPAFARPDRVGAAEIVVFVFVPPLLPLLFGWQVRDAAVTMFVNAALLALVYGATSYGLVPMTRWAVGQFGRRVLTVAQLLIRALPLLLLFVTFLFINTEVWQTASGLTWPVLLLVMGLFVAIGGAFAVMRLPRQIGELTEFESWDTLESRCVGTPVEDLLATTDEPSGGTPPLSGRQWGNVGLVVLASEGIQILLVAGLVFAFFVLLGFLAIGTDVIASWLGEPPADPILTVDLWGQQLVLTTQLLHVAAFLAAFSGLYFTVFLLTDATYRHEFLDEVLDEVRDALAVRAVYLAALAQTGPGGAESPDGAAAASATISAT